MERFGVTWLVPRIFGKEALKRPWVLASAATGGNIFPPLFGFDTRRLNISDILRFVSRPSLCKFAFIAPINPDVDCKHIRTNIKRPIARTANSRITDNYTKYDT
jgi:hypothetical protein